MRARKNLSWLKESETYPLTLKPLKPFDITASKNLEHDIRIWRKDNGLSLDKNNKDFKPL
jgi:hypothetical protein